MSLATSDEHAKIQRFAAILEATSADLARQAEIALEFDRDFAMASPTSLASCKAFLAAEKKLAQITIDDKDTSVDDWLYARYRLRAIEDTERMLERFFS